MRRATFRVSGIVLSFVYFYPRPPRGGRHLSKQLGKEGYAISIHALREEGDLTTSTTERPSSSFLSTPSARRATLKKAAENPVLFISIHALREEGDLCRYGRSFSARHFYPRPPRGGRQTCLQNWSNWSRYFYPRPPRGGRHFRPRLVLLCFAFLSTPSARRATLSWRTRRSGALHFYPRPPRGGRLQTVSR